MKKTKSIFTVILMALLVFVMSGSGTYTAHAAAVKPGKPALVSVTNKAAGITVKWKKSANASGYYIYRKTASASYKRIGEVKGQNTVTYTDKTVKNSQGTAYIYTVRAYNGNVLSKYNAAGMKIVREYPVAIKLNKTKVSLRKGSSITLKATASGKVTWSSSDPNVATVKNGKVTAKKAGKATITAKADGKTATCTVTVTDAVDYKTLYNNFLAAHKVEKSGDLIIANCYYMFDIDGMGSPELIVVDYVNTTTYPTFPYYMNNVYTIKNNKVSLVGDFINFYKGNISFDYNKTYHAIYQESGSLSSQIDRKDYSLYKLSGSKLVQMSAAGYISKDSSITYSTGVDPDTKNVSKAEYDKYFKKYFTNITRYKMLKNTAANRAKTFA